MRADLKYKNALRDTQDLTLIRMILIKQLQKLQLTLEAEIFKNMIPYHSIIVSKTPWIIPFLA